MKSITFHILYYTIAGLLTFLITGCRGDSDSSDNRLMLWNGIDFTGWKIVAPSADVNNVWSIREGVIYCTGVPNGYIRTEAEYENYQLHVEWRWPEQPANSGVFVHTVGEDNIWPQTIECQLQAGNAGAFVLMNGAGITIDGQNMQNPNRQFVMVNKKEQSSEMPAGEWNSYDIHCQGDTIRCYVNEVLQNEGTGASQTSGYICLQSEGGPIEFRNIYIRKLEE